MADRLDSVQKAKLAELLKRYDEVLAEMKKVASVGEELTEEERRLLSSAYKNVICPRRTSWKSMSCMELKEQAEGEEDKVEIVRQYRLKIESEMKNICEDVFNLLDHYLIPSASTAESKVFYYKMKGDYFRYLAEFLTEFDRNEAVENGSAAYKTAYSIAMAELPSTNRTRLGLALNYSLFHLAILDSPDEACRLAQHALDCVLEELPSLAREESKESAFIVRLLEDNLTFWKSQGKFPGGETGEQLEQVDDHAEDQDIMSASIPESHIPLGAENDT